MRQVAVVLGFVLAACGGSLDPEPSGCPVAADRVVPEAGSDARSPGEPVDAGADADAADAIAVDPCAQTAETQLQCYGTDTSAWRTSKPIACRDAGGCTITAVHADWSAAPAAAWCCP